jgi:serine phosphatase RsbU (regulator of sigma subunit)
MRPAPDTAVPAAARHSVADWLMPWGVARAALSIVGGCLVVVGMVNVVTSISGLDNRPSSAMMGSLIIVTVVSMFGGPLAGVVVAAIALAASDYYLARPFHSFAIDSAAVEILFAAFAVTSVVIAGLVGWLAMARRDAEAATAGGVRMQRLTASLSRARTAEEVYGAILTEGREILAAGAGMIVLPIEGSDALALVASVGFTPEELAGWERIEATPKTPVGEAFRLGLPLLVDDAERRRRFPDLPGLGAPTASVPLHTGERPIGALGFRFAAGRRFTDDDRALLTSLGDLCAQALERARLYDAEHRARESLAVLAHVGEHLQGSLDAEETLRTFAALVVPAVADQCVVDLLVDGSIRRLVAVHADPAVQDAARALERSSPDLASDTPVAVAIRTRQTQVVPVTADLPASAYRSPEHREAVQRLGLRSLLATPLVVRGRTLGALSFGSRREHAFGAEELALAHQLARRVSLALDNARLYEVQREIAHTLQQSLLPGTLVQPEGIEIAARYRPSGEGAEVGGDFYDAWQTADGGLAVAIGDVAGKGPRAAALTALTRHAMRVASRYERSPSRILEVVNETILGQARGAEFCTALVALIVPDADGATCTSACAGHAPPLILRGATGVVEEAGAWGTLLGAVTEATFTDFATQLAPGDAVVCWTDGVTERRVEGEMFGEERLRDLVASLVGASAERLAAGIDDAVVAYAPGLPDDDVAILTLRLVGSAGLRAADPAAEVPDVAGAD